MHRHADAPWSQQPEGLTPDTGSFLKHALPSMLQTVWSLEAVPVSKARFYNLVEKLYTS